MSCSDLLSRVERYHPDFLKRFGRSLSIKRGARMFEAGAEIGHVYLLKSGLVSLFAPLSGGGCVDAAIVGRGALIGGGSLFGIRVRVSSMLAQTASSAWALPAADFAAVAHEDDAVFRLACLQEQLLFVQAQQTAACNAVHSVRERLCRRLLCASDLISGNMLRIGQQELAQMLGVQRTSISIAANQMQKMGLIRHRYGQIEIINRPGLLRNSCECYEAISNIKRKLMDHNPKSDAVAAESAGSPPIAP
jgi:CRP-like cAMP-binding protein